MWVVPEDIPILLGSLDDEVKTLYADLETIIGYVDENLTINSIAQSMNIEPSVLVAVFTELHKRGLIAFKE